MDQTQERNLGPQPIADIMDLLGLKSHDLVTASTEQITHKMIARARKGRRLTQNTKLKIRNALNAAAEKDYSLKDIFNY
jgi:hypothetical protein